MGVSTTHTTIRPADLFGPVLVGRDEAADLRRDVEQRVEAGERVVFDFSGVVALAPSFADELLAKLPPHALDGGKVAVEHLDRSSSGLVEMAISRRR
ncbi:STAS-like domain-containing protein [Conexibacter sp. JD483]|uniref:STAS-like domain-containing protein n=1 Tax=unclassified Conexibacter TaxID=2627773 RepID=UPI00271C137B|nr:MULTISPECIES: STAS-like domain-containing protein [unclassified Conexibacter]MDO8184638.1 STAS-like domain-containing protein [Conexibacter sp. CPCC 205706]MDO8197944.1 STAS-like domain-containing protein [Conexibacter sp. CPCC 205762]MDR9368374.1 STAS-like domain-containing protein [Conexibacter sp. JD483]